MKDRLFAFKANQQSALFGQACFAPGESKCTYGTGAFLLMNTGSKPIFSKNGLVTTIGWGLNGQVTYALEGSIFVAGAAIQWLRDNLGVIEKASDSQALAESVPSSDGVYFVSTFQGLGAPWWENGRRASIHGMTRKTTAAHIVRAALESVAYRVTDVVGAMEREMGLPCKSLRVDGGMSANDFLMQFQSDILQIPVSKTANPEVTALGTAFMAGLVMGIWPDQQALQAMVTESRRLYPQMKPEDASALYQGWLETIGQA